MSRSSASLQSSPHQQHSHPDLQRPPHPWQEVSAQAQARPARCSESGRMADSAPNTDYGPELANFFSCMDLEHTQINIPTATSISCAQTTPTVIPTQSRRLPTSGASSSSKQTTASRVPLMFGPFSLWKQGACRVSGRSGLQITGAELDRESVAATLCSVHSRKGRTNAVHSLKDRENLQNNP